MLMVVDSLPGVGTSFSAVPSPALVCWFVVTDDLALPPPSFLPGACSDLGEHPPLLSC